MWELSGDSFGQPEGSVLSVMQKYKLNMVSAFRELKIEYKKKKVNELKKLQKSEQKKLIYSSENDQTALVVSIILRVRSNVVTVVTMVK